MKVLNGNLTAALIWKIVGAAASVVIAWVWIQSQFLGVTHFEAYAANQKTQFEVYASGVQSQQALTTKALLMQELRWLQSQRREAKKDGDSDEIQRLTDEIETIKLQLKGL
jgi:hypothetical protein